jgi:hypothetical protein
LNLPHFHLYGADICLQARRNGLANYAMSNFCVHNSIAIRTLPAEFWRCAEYLRIKWQDELPVKTSCIVLSRGQSAMWIRRTRTELGFLRARKARGASHRLANPKINPACGTNPK